MPVNSGITRLATASQITVSAPSTIRISQNSDEASRNASRLRPCCMRSAKTGTNAADNAACENRLLNRFGIWEATVNAEAAGVVPKKLAWTTSRASPATLDNAVASAKIAVLRASLRRAWGGGAAGGSPPTTVLSTDTSAL